MRIPDADILPVSELLTSATNECSTRRSELEEEVAGLFEQFRNPLFRYLLSLGLTFQDGEEILQDIFLALFRHLKSGKPRHNLRGWIFRVGHNQALKLRTRNSARLFQPDDDLAERQHSPYPNPEEQAYNNQRQRRLAAVVRALPEQDRACLSLRAEGFRYREISEILGVSLGSVALSLDRSLAKLGRVRER